MARIPSTMASRLKLCSRAKKGAPEWDLRVEDGAKKRFVWEAAGSNSERFPHCGVPN